MGQDRINAEHRAHAQASGAVDHVLYAHRGDVPWSLTSPPIALGDWPGILAAAQQSGSALDSALAGSSVSAWWNSVKGAGIPDSTADRIAAVRAAILM